MSLFKDISNVLSKRGYNYIAQDHRQKIEQWLSYYRGNINNFQTYYRRINGKTKSFKRKSTQLANTLASDRTKLIFAEDYKISADKNDERLQEILEDTNFYGYISQFYHKIVGYAGFGAIVPIVYKDGTVDLDFITARNLEVISYNNNRIDGICTVSTEKIESGSRTEYFHLLTYHYKSGKDYVIENELYRSTTASMLGIEVELDRLEAFKDLEPLTTYTNTKPHFVIINTSGANNHDVDAPYSIPVIANTTDLIRKIEWYHSELEAEFKAKRARVLISNEAMKSHKDANLKREVNYFDENETFFQAFNSDTEGGVKDPIKEVSTSSIRAKEYEDTINMIYKELGRTAGMGQDYYSFDIMTGRATATQVVSDKMDAYKTKMLDERILTIATKKLVKSIGQLLSIDFGDIQIAYNDSVLDTDKERRELYMQLESHQILPKWKVLMNNLKISEKEARELVLERAREEVLLDAIIDGSQDEEPTEETV